MALTYQAAVEQTIAAGEQIHQIVNGTATTEVTVEDGSKVPSIRKALIDNFYFKDPIAWQAGQTENVFNQLRQFTDGSWWYAPSATASNPISMGVTPVGNPLWKIYDFDAIGKLEPRVDEALRRSYAEAGYNVVGTFQAGFTYVNANDVGIDLATGKGYTGPSGTVAAGTNPASGGFVDRSGAALSGNVEIQAASIEAMISGVAMNGAVYRHVVGQRWSTGQTSWEVLAVPVTTIDDFTTIGGYERCFSEFGGKGDYILYQLNPIARHLPFKTTNNIVNPTPTDNSTAMASAMAAQKLYGFQLIIEPGHYYFTKKTKINSAFHISGRSRSAAQSYLQKSDVTLYLDSPDSNESVFEFEADTVAQTNTNMQGSSLTHLLFKQVNQTALNQHMIRCHNVGWSYSTISHLTFLETTGYGIYFISDFDLYDAPMPYQTTYFQNTDFTNLGFQICGGTIGNNGVSNRIATKGVFRNWNCEGRINRPSPQPWYLNMMGMKDYCFENVIMEGGDATGINSLIKMGNFAENGDIFTVVLDGLWIEYLQNPTTFIIAGGCDLDFNNLKTAVPTAQAAVSNFISFTKPFSRARFTNSNLYPWGANLCLFNGLEKNISVSLENCSVRDLGEMLAGTVAKQNRFEFKNMLSSLGTKRVFSDFLTSVKMYEWDGASLTGGGVVSISHNASSASVVAIGGGEGNAIKLDRTGTFTTFSINLAFSPELVGQDVVVGYRLKTTYSGAKLAVYTSAANYEEVVYVNQTIADADKTSFVNCYAVLGNIKQANISVSTLPTTGPSEAHTVWISDIIVSVGKTIFQMMPGRV